MQLRLTTFPFLDWSIQNLFPIPDGGIYYLIPILHGDISYFFSIPSGGISYIFNSQNKIYIATTSHKMMTNSYIITKHHSR